jgi:hypothetical protein
MMILGQMQDRPQNSDLQEYYRKQSNDKRRKSKSRLDRSTEKIYMQKLDKKRWLLISYYKHEAKLYKKLFIFPLLTGN